MTLRGIGGPALDVFGMERGGGRWTVVASKRSERAAVVRVDFAFRER